MRHLNDWDADEALVMARCSQRAYSPCGGDNIRIIETSPDGGCCVMACDRVEGLVISFRGSSTLGDWLTDSECERVLWPGYPGLVHRGFANRIAKLWTWLESSIAYRRRSVIQPIWVTGHSLGGALATLAALRLDRRGLPVMPVYTFGAPRVGNAAFAAGYDIELYRTINDLDIVPHSPPAWGYRHTGTPVLMDDEGVTIGSTWLHWLDSLGHRLTRRGVFAAAAEELTDHAIDAYVGRLERMAADGAPDEDRAQAA